MSSFERRTVVGFMLVSMAALPGCLTPMLAADAPAAALHGQIDFPETDDRFGFFLRQSLAARLGETDKPIYRLQVGKKIMESGVAISQENTATRINLLVEASWRLVRVRDGAAVLADQISLQSGYNATASLYATRQTRRDIERRLARSLGERISRTIQARAGEITA